MGNFDLDLQYGKSGEKFVEFLGVDRAKVEVKSERDIWLLTQRVAIEFECRGKPSGLATTEAEWWVHLLTYSGVVVGGYIWPVYALKGLLRKAYINPAEYNCQIKSGGDDNASRMMLMPLNQLHAIPLLGGAGIPPHKCSAGQGEFTW